MNKLKLLFTVLFLAVLGLGNVWAEDSYVQLQSIADIDESADYVLGIDGTGFHVSGTSSWGVCSKPSDKTPLTYKLKKAADGNSFTAQTTISSKEYFLQVPTTNAFSMVETSASSKTNIDLIIGTTQVSGTNYAVANKGTTARHLRINGTSGLRSYAGTTGSMAFFYKVVSAGPTVSSISIKTAPSKVDYVEGQKFNPAGLVITKTMSEGDPVDVEYAGNESAFTFSPALTTELATTNTKVTITVGGKSVDQAITVGAFTPTAGEYDIALNNAFYGVSTGNNGTEQSAEAKGITVVSGCKSSATSKTYYDTDHIRYYTDSYLKLTAPDGFEITKVVFTANGTWNAGPTVTIGSYNNSTKTWTGNTAQLDMSFATQNRAKSIKVTYAAPATLQSITVSGEPTKKAYTAGENFNPAGLVVTGNYSDESHRPITEGITWSTPAALTAGQTSVEITATVAGVTSAAYEVTGLTVVAAKNLDHITLNTDDVTKVFWKGETFNYANLVVTAYYDDETNNTVEPLSVSAPNMTLFGEAQTITVSYKEGGVTKETTYEIEVKTIANTQETAYTTTEAIALIVAGKDLSTEVYVTGVISSLGAKKDNQNAFNSTYKSMTYWLDGDAFEVYSGKNLNNTDFASDADLKVGGTVVVYGVIKAFVSGGNTTYEFDKNNYLVSYVAPTVERTTGTISGTNKTSLSTDDADDVYEITYNGDGELSVLSSNPDAATISLEGTTVTVHPIAAGSTTITISAPQTENYTAATKTYTLTVKAGLSAAALPFTFDGGASDINVANGIKAEGLGSNYSSSPKLKFDGAGDYVVVRVAEAIKKVEYKIKGNSYTAGQFDVLQSADGKTYTALKSYTSDMPSDATVETTAKPAADTRYIKFVYTTKNAGNVALGAINITAASALESPELAFGQASYTFFADAADMQVTASSAAGSEGAITYALTAGDADAFLIDENTGNIVCETAGTYTVTATIAAAGEFDTQSVNVVVTINEPEDLGDAISIVFPYGETFYAMKKDLSVVEVIYANNKLINVAEADKADLTWYKKEADGKATFRNAEGKYLAGASSTTLTVQAGEYKWDVKSNYYSVVIGSTERTFLYNGSEVKNYAKSNAGGTYSELAVIATGFGSGNVVCGTNIYETLAEAIAAEDGGTINVLVDLNENIVVPAGKTFTLDLNGHTLNGAQTASTATIKNLGTLTIENGTVLRSGAGSASFYIIENEGTMTLNCNVSGSASSSLIRNNAATASMTFEGGEYTQTGAFIVVKNDLGEVIVNDGIFSTAADKNVLNNWDQMTINGGTFNGCILNGAYDTNNNTLVINDGTFNTDKIRTYLGNGQTDANIEIKGGEFTSESLVYQGPTSANDAQVAISGGTFHTAVPAIYCAEDFQPLDNGDGTYGVQEAIKVVSIVLGGEYAQSFTVGDEFAFAGTVTATYNREKADADVTSVATFTGYDMSILGKQTVTVSYTEDEVTVETTYQITVKADPTDLTQEEVNPTEIYASAVTDIDLTLNSYEGDALTITYSAGTNTSNQPGFFVSDKTIRTYKNNTITISSSSKSIYMVEISYKSDANADKGMGVYANNHHGYVVCNGTSNVVLTATGTSRITNITVYYEDQKEEVRDGLSVGKYGTICVEKMTLAPAGAHFYTLNQYDEASKTLTVSENTTGRLEAGVPYIFEAEGAEIAGIVVANDETAKNNNGLYAVLGSDYYADGSEYGIVGNEVRPAAVGALFRAGRCYIKLGEVSTTGSGSAPARAFRVIGGTNVTTGLEGLELIEGATKLLHNGQVVILRDGKCFDVIGRLVK